MIEFATVARPYAKAIFKIANEKQQWANWSDALTQLSVAVQQPKVAAFIDQVETAAEDKANGLFGLLDNVQNDFGIELKNFLSVLAIEKRLSVLPEIYTQYQELQLSRDNIKQAVIYTAYDIAEDQKSQIVRDLEQRFNVCLRATFQTDSALIGGIKVEVGDQVWDLSVQAKLQELYATMTN